MNRRMIFVGAALAGVLAAGTATAALADTGSPSPSTPQAPKTHAKQHRKAGLAARCKREPQQAARVDKLIATISGDANTKGSVAWLNAEAAKVQPKDPAMAAIITDRAQIRQSQLAALKLRKDELSKIAAYCGTKGHPVGS